MPERCDGRYPVSHPRDEPFDVTYRCGLDVGHSGAHGRGAELRFEVAMPEHEARRTLADTCRWLADLHRDNDAESEVTSGEWGHVVDALRDAAAALEAPREIAAWDGGADWPDKFARWWVCRKCHRAYASPTTGKPPAHCVCFDEHAIRVITTAAMTAWEDVALRWEPAVLESPVTLCNSLKSCENTKESKCTLAAGESSPSRPMAAGWTPTAANVNALPEPIRRYIHQLQTNCDPSGDTQERVIAQDICRTQAIQLEQAEQQIATLTKARDFQRQRADRGWALYGKTLTKLVDLEEIDVLDLREQIATLTAERDQLQADLYGKPPYRPGAYAQIELEIKVRDEYLTRAEAAEARAIALEAGFRKLKTLVDLRFMNEETQNIIATATQALLSPHPPSKEMI